MAKRNLTTEKICETALQLIEAAGIENLSMRKLAAKLHVEAASLYHHITNKSELFDLIQEHLYAQLPGELSEQNWQEHLCDLAIHTRKGLLQVPNMVVLFATRPTITVSSLKQAEKTLTILINAGFQSSEALAIFRNLHAFVLGHVLAEVGRVPGEDDDNDEPSLANINIEDYPVLQKTYLDKSNSDFEKGFKLGLTTMMSGLEILLRKK